MIKRSLILLALGGFVLLFCGAIVWWGGLPVTRLQVQASDWLFVQADGPRLGARPASSEISLVLLDVRSAAVLGNVRSYAEDVTLYRRLFDAGARVVYDTRTLAAAEPDTFAEFQPLLESMLEIDDNGRLMRDVVLSPDLLTQTESRYDVLSAANVARAQPHQVSSLRSRMYPLFQVSGEGPSESAPLRIARNYLRIKPPTGEQIAEQMKTSGVVAAWHQQAPEMIPHSDVPPSPYRFGDREILWYPFATTTILVPPAGFWVSYDPAADDYSQTSYIDALEETSAIDCRDKIVIIGVSSETDILDDPYEIPSKFQKGAAAEVVALAVQTILDQRMVRDPPRWFQFGILGILCAAFAQIGGWLRPLQAIGASLALLAVYCAAAVGGYRAGWFVDVAAAPMFGLLSGFLGFAYSAWASIRSRQRVVELFGRYVPRAVVNQLMLKPELQRLTLGGTRRDVSVLFADIRGFTSFSEDLKPEEVVLQLNSLLETMVDSTFEHDGTLDKFIGDAVLVLFNAPLDQDDHVRRAVATATSIQQRLAGHPSGLRVGIGIHRGEAVVGNIGTQQRLEYTAIGSTVNIASRLCSLAQPGEVILSSSVIAELPPEVMTESLGPVQVKGIKQSLVAHRIVSAFGRRV